MPQNKHKRILMVGSARESGGGVSSVIRLMEKMPLFSSDGGYEMYWLGTQIQRNYLWKMWYAIKAAVIAFFIMWRYDIVHFHTTPDKLGLLIQMPELLLAKLWRKKVILHIHVGNQLKTQKNGLFVWCLKKANLVVLLAKKWERLFKNYYEEVDVLTTVLYNPVERNDDVNFDNRKKNIIMMAYFNENKGTDVLLKSLAILLSSRKKSGQYDKNALNGWSVYMLGNGEVERYKQMAHDLGLENIVTFTGYVTGKERDAYLNSASIYCMCSYEEGFPMVVLESWMNGIAVVTTPVGGLPDVIEEGKNCLTFDFGDSEGLARQLQHMMNDSDLRRNMVQYSRKFVEEHFSMAKANSELERIYRC